MFEELGESSSLWDSQICPPEVFMPVWGFL